MRREHDNRTIYVQDSLGILFNDAPSMKKRMLYPIFIRDAS